MRVRLTCFTVVLAFAFASIAQAAIPGTEPSKSWDLNGYVKYMATATLPNDGEHLFDNLVHQRLNYEYRFTPALRFNLGMRNRFMWGDSAKNSYYSDYIGLDNGYLDLSKNWGEGDGRVGNSQLDRLYIDWNKDEWQLRGGRFRVNWGMTRIWNPNDVFNAYSVYDFDYEERSGTDALMASYKLGFASSVDVVYTPSNASTLNSYGLRYLFNAYEWDGQLIAGKTKQDNFIGAGFAGDIKGAGLRGEISYFDPSDESREATDQYAATLSSIEMDYLIGGARNWMVTGAVLHNSNPQEPINAAAFVNLPLTAKTLSFTSLTSYLDIGFDLTVLNKATLSAIYYQDGSYFLGFSNQYSLNDNWQVLAVIQYFDGDKNSLFSQSASTMLFAQIKWNF